VLEISIAAGTGADVMLGAASAAVAAPESTRRDASPTFWRCSAPKHFLWARRQSAVSWGFDVLEISIAAGTGADLMAGSAGAAGAAPDVLHHPQGYPGFIARGAPPPFM